jgi:hypothetical protein
VFDVTVVTDAPNNNPTIASTPRDTVPGKRLCLSRWGRDPRRGSADVHSARRPGGHDDGATASCAGRRPPPVWRQSGHGPRDRWPWQTGRADVHDRCDLATPAVYRRSRPREAGATAVRVYRDDATAADPDGDPVAWTLVSGPTGLSVDPGTGTVRQLPSATQVGTHEVVLRVTDGLLGQAEQRYTVTVRASMCRR